MSESVSIEVFAVKPGECPVCFLVKSKRQLSQPVQANIRHAVKTAFANTEYANVPVLIAENELSFEMVRQQPAVGEANATQEDAGR